MLFIVSSILTLSIIFRAVFWNGIRFDSLTIFISVWRLLLSGTLGSTPKQSIIFRAIDETVNVAHSKCIKLQRRFGLR